jgi:hypothetical protein
VGTTSTEDDDAAVTELATATGGDGLRALFGPRLSLGDPSPPPIGGVLGAGGELAVVTVSSPISHTNISITCFRLQVYSAQPNLAFNTLILQRNALDI